MKRLLPILNLFAWLLAVVQVTLYVIKLKDDSLTWFQVFIPLWIVVGVYVLFLLVAWLLVIIEHFSDEYYNSK